MRFRDVQNQDEIVRHSLSLKFECIKFWLRKINDWCSRNGILGLKFNPIHTQNDLRKFRC
jgi:hypothetical protein